MSSQAGGAGRQRWSLAAAAGLAAIVVLATACGSSGTSPSTTTVPGHPNSAQQFSAEYLNLVSTDLPHGWTKEPQGRGPNVVRTSLNGCVAAAPGVATPVATAASPNFLNVSNGKEIGSQVQVYKSPADASRAAAAAGTSAASSCLQASITTKLPPTLPSTESLKHVTVTTGPDPSKVTGDFAQEVTTLLTYPIKAGETGGSTVFIDVVGFSSGAALIEAEFESTGSPPSPALEQATMAALRKRAAGH